MTNWEYIGDSVYVRINENGEVVLALNNGEGPYSEITLEEETLYNFQKFIEQTLLEAEQESNEE